MDNSGLLSVSYHPNTVEFSESNSVVFFSNLESKLYQLYTFSVYFQVSHV